jgi:hypothetical protein
MVDMFGMYIRRRRGRQGYRQADASLVVLGNETVSRGELRGAKLAGQD